MVSRSKSSISLALYFLAALAAVPTTQAQLSTVPKRHRSESNNHAQQQFGRRQRRRRSGGGTRRRMVDASSMPLEYAAFDHASSMPLEYAALDLSLSMPTEAPPVQIESDGQLESANVGGGGAVLGSFLAGLSVLVVGGTAFLARARRARGRQGDGGGAVDDLGGQVVSSPKAAADGTAAFEDRDEGRETTAEGLVDVAIL